MGPCLIKKGNVNLGLDETHFGAGITTITCDGFVTSYYSGSKQKHEVRDKDGNVLEYHAPDGKKLPTEEEFKNGKDGTFLSFEQNGIWRQTTYKNGKKNGPEIEPYRTTIYKDDKETETYENDKRMKDFPRQEEVKTLWSAKSISKSSLKRTLTANANLKSGQAITPERQPLQKKVSVNSILPSKSEQR